MAKQEQEKFSKYEKARMIGSRALQISMGAPPEIKLSSKDLEKIKYNPLEIAKMEFEKGVIPLKIRRSTPKPVDEKEKEAKVENNINKDINENE